MKLKKPTMKKKTTSSNFDILDEYRDEDIFERDEKGMPIQRNSANARERARMRVLSSAFYRLKTIIPWVPHDTKLSKLDTLRLARNYIAYLSATLEGQPVNEVNSKIPQPQKMTWPYIFQVPEISDFRVNKTTDSLTKINERNENVLDRQLNGDAAAAVYKYNNAMNLKYSNDSDSIYD